MFYLQRCFQRLERSMYDCMVPGAGNTTVAAYHGTADEGFALVMSYNGLFTYLFFLVYTLVLRRRNRFIWVLWTGLGFAGFLVWVLGWLPFATNADAACQAEPGSKPADDASIVSFVCVYYFVYHALYGGLDRWHLLLLVASLVAQALSFWALWYLRLQSTLSLLSGWSVGVVAACASHWFTRLVLSHLGDFPRLLNLLRWTTCDRCSCLKHTDDDEENETTQPLFSGDGRS